MLFQDAALDLRRDHMIFIWYFPYVDNAQHNFKSQNFEFKRLFVRFQPINHEADIEVIDVS